MTGAEMERAIEFLLAQQARFAEDMGALRARVDGLAGVADTALEVANRTAETVELLAGKMTEAAEAQRRTDERLEKVAGLVGVLAEEQRETGAVVRQLARLVEAHLSDGHGGPPAGLTP